MPAHILLLIVPYGIEMMKSDNSDYCQGTFNCTLWN